MGVGQSEIMVSQMSDIFVLLLSPGGGDELQGVKRGIMEIADLIVVNKADGDLLSAAKRTQTDYSSALGLLKVREEDMEGFPKVSLVSSISGEGLDTVWILIRHVWDLLSYIWNTFGVCFGQGLDLEASG